MVAAAVLLLRCTVLGLSSEAGIRPCLGGRFRLLVRNASSVGLLVELRFGSIDCSIPDPSSSPAWRGFVCCLRGVLVAAYLSLRLKTFGSVLVLFSGNWARRSCYSVRGNAEIDDWQGYFFELRNCCWLDPIYVFLLLRTKRMFLNWSATGPPHFAD